MTDRSLPGGRTAGAWRALLADASGPVHSELAELYGGADQIGEAVSACRRAVDAFAEAWGPDREVVLIRSTGRINLMGMHIDHRGGPVNPIAIKDVFLVVEPRDDDTVVLRNVESREFPDERFVIHECLPQGKIADWDNWSHDELAKRKGDPGITWSSYARAAVLYWQHTHTRDDGTFDPALKGMNIMVCGNIPRAAGLSTSSSLVTATAEACIHVNGLACTPKEFVDACGYGEWYVGTRGGSGDHAAIKFGRPNAIVHMKDFSRVVEPVPFPPDYRVVLANSLVEAKKQVGARDAFNGRVASYVYGLLLVRRKFPRYAPKLAHLRDINPGTLGVSEADIFRMLLELPETADRAQVLAMLPDDVDEVQHVFRSHAEPAEGYKIRQVVLFGIAECLRAAMAPERLRAGDVAGFGELLNVSHDGDRVTRMVDGQRVPQDNRIRDGVIHDLIADAQSGEPERVERSRLWRQPGGYDCSCEGIDVLVDVAREVPGVVGARLVGAGLGGSMVAVVEDDRTRDVIGRMAEEYYRPRGLPVAVEVVQPVGGCGILHAG